MGGVGASWAKDVSGSVFDDAGQGVLEVGDELVYPGLLTEIIEKAVEFNDKVVTGSAGGGGDVGIRGEEEPCVGGDSVVVRVARVA